MIDLSQFTPFQQAALQHPVKHEPNRFSPVPDACSHLEPPWKIIVEVREMPQPIGWCWIASVSRLRKSGRGIQVVRWKAKWVKRAQGHALELPEGVGEDSVPLQAILPIDLTELHGVYASRTLRADEVNLLEQLTKGTP